MVRKVFYREPKTMSRYFTPEDMLRPVHIQMSKALARATYLFRQRYLFLAAGAFAYFIYAVGQQDFSIAKDGLQLISTVV